MVLYIHLFGLVLSTLSFFGELFDSWIRRGIDKSIDKIDMANDEEEWSQSDGFTPLKHMK